MLNEIININSNSVFDVAEVSVGQHYYWEIGGYSVHGQVLTGGLFFIPFYHLQEIVI
jgi:hypothetical protein